LKVDMNYGSNSIEQCAAATVQNLSFQWRLQ